MPYSEITLNSFYNWLFPKLLSVIIDAYLVKPYIAQGKHYHLQHQCTPPHILYS